MPLLSNIISVAALKIVLLRMEFQESPEFLGPAINQIESSRNSNSFPVIVACNLTEPCKYFIH